MDGLFITDLLVLLPLLIGIALLVIEIFLPGFGIPGICGLIMEGIAIWLTATRHGTSAALILTAIVLLITALTIFLAFRSATKGRLSKTSLVLNETEQADSVVFPGVDPGEEGIALTALRPSGTALFGDRRMDVMTEGDFVQKNQKISVVRTEGSKVIVRTI